MASEENLLGTPSGYATPDQLKGVREYAKALLQGSLQQPVQHWTQGVSNMVSALVGGNMAYRAGQQENEANAVEGGRLVPTIGGAGASGPLAGGDTGSASKAIAGIESGGSYDKLGPIVPKTGDRAYGKYQVMGNNIPEWTQASLGKSMTPEEFRASPEAQEAVFKNKFGEYTKKYGPEGAARAWFAGEGGMNDLKRSDQLGTTVASYGKRFAKAYGAEGGTPSKAIQAVSSALRNEPPTEAGVQLAAGGAKPVAKPQMAPDGSGIFYDPALIKRPPQYNEAQIRGIMGSPRISDAMKAQALQTYQAQGQPIVMPWPGGQIIIDPSNPTRQQFVPEGHWGKSELGDMKTDQFLVPTGRGGVNQIIPSQSPGPRSDAGPVPGVAPAVSPAGGPPAPVMAQNASTAPVGPSEGTVSVAPAAAPVKVASLDPTAGGTSTAAVDAGAVPVAATPVAAPTPAAPLKSFAQATPPGATPEQLRLHGFSEQQIQDYTAKKAYDNAQTLVQEKGKADIGVTAEAQKKSNDMGAKRYEEMLGRVESATEQRKNVSTARAMMADDNFYAGLGSGLVENWKQLKVALGVDPNASAPMEVFRKTTAQSIMSGLKTAFGGLGQIRVAEIELQKIANASTNNSPAAIRVLLEITDRNAALVQDLGEMTTAYKSGVAVMDPRDPTKMLLPANLGPDGQPMERNGVDAKFDRVAQKYAKDNPTFSKEEYANFEKIMKAPGTPDKAPAAPVYKKGDTQEFDAPGGGKVKGVFDGTKWGPVK